MVQSELSVFELTNLSWTVRINRSLLYFSAISYIVIAVQSQLSVSELTNLYWTVRINRSLLYFSAINYIVIVVRNERDAVNLTPAKCTTYFSGTSSTVLPTSTTRTVCAIYKIIRLTEFRKKNWWDVQICFVHCVKTKAALFLMLDYIKESTEKKRCHILYFHAMRLQAICVFLLHRINIADIAVWIIEN